MMVQLLQPVVKQLKARSRSSGEEREGPAPSVEVTQAAEDEWYAKMRAQMAKMVWEVDGGIVFYSLSVVLVRSALTLPLSRARSRGTSTRASASARPCVRPAPPLPSPSRSPSLYSTVTDALAVARSPLEPARVPAPDARGARGALRLVPLRLSALSFVLSLAYFLLLPRVPTLCASLALLPRSFPPSFLSLPLDALFRPSFLAPSISPLAPIECSIFLSLLWPYLASLVPWSRRRPLAVVHLARLAHLGAHLGQDSAIRRLEGLSLSLSLSLSCGFVVVERQSKLQSETKAERGGTTRGRRPRRRKREGHRAIGE